MLAMTLSSPPVFCPAPGLGMVRLRLSAPAYAEIPLPHCPGAVFCPRLCRDSFAPLPRPFFFHPPSSPQRTVGQASSFASFLGLYSPRPPPSFPFLAPPHAMAPLDPPPPPPSWPPRPSTKPASPSPVRRHRYHLPARQRPRPRRPRLPAPWPVRPRLLRRCPEPLAPPPPPLQMPAPTATPPSPAPATTPRVPARRPTPAEPRPIRPELSSVLLFLSSFIVSLRRRASSSNDIIDCANDPLQQESYLQQRGG